MSAAAEAHAAKGEPYHAIEKYDRAADVLAVLNDQQDRVRELKENRETIEATLAFSGDAVLEYADGPRLLRIGSSIEIGRRDDNRLDEIHVGCRLVSRMGRQARIAYQDGEFRITDLGSTNGTFVGEFHVQSKQSTTLGVVADVKLGGGLNPPKPGFCTIRCERIDGPVPAMAMSFQSETSNLPAEIAENWPTMAADHQYGWILTPGPLLIGGSGDCAVRLRDAPAEVMAQLTSNGGHMIEPCADHIILVNGARVIHPVKLGDNVEIDIGGSKIRFLANATYFKEHPPG